MSYSRFAGEKRLSLAQKRAQLAEKREWREKNKNMSELMRHAQVQFNKFIRERDFDDGCISCHMGSGYQGQWHAGHYRTVGAAKHLRFNEDNCHKQCAQCNEHKSGNLVEYRKRLIAKIGVERVEVIENDNSVVKWDRESIKATAKKYSKKWRALQKVREAREHAAN